ncbi:hypothetical protein HDC92_000173 [Pedobacter sp. AK017]|uniref:hypothetical protein n=1 Tax=Pedobacter sp. AK017 TaxID=2723073 RepID=UPI00160E5DAC|nr:hypothetical protein [Pedobacter sp. AK017]MBB5436509.1 hypothetical protein [Pedobacter sp. AK017]
MKPEEMPNPEYSHEESDKIYQEWLASLPVMIEENYNKFIERTKLFDSFQLIANICHYNHQHDANQYTDYREDRMFIISEIVAIHCLRNEYKDTCELMAEDFFEAISEVQEAVGKYFGLQSALSRTETCSEEESTLEQITNKLHRDEILVRNPGHPDHHLLFSGELFKPLSKELNEHFGFTLEESIIIRQQLLQMISIRFFSEIDAAKVKGDQLKDQVVRFRNTGQLPEESPLTIEQFRELANKPSKKLKEMFGGYYINEVLYNLKSVYTFTAEELASHCRIPTLSAENFLKHLSIGFGTIDKDQHLISSNSILKTKPIINHGQHYIVPSFSLLTWSVEPLYENYIKTDQKLSSKFKDVKHDFLLNKGMEYFSILFRTGVVHPQNLFYEKDGKVCETDGLIAYDTILFIIEAKGNRISMKAKQGNYQRTEAHLKDLIRDATSQGKRTMDFIKESEEAVFFTKGKREKIIIDPKKFDEFFIVSLTLEPVGHLTPLIKVANDLKFFPEDVFPWIISIYDLVVIADHIELPILFLHYLRRRKRFLELNHFSIYEEIDLLAYFLFDGLYIENLLRESNEKNISMMSFDNNTDEINDYYMYKFGHKTKFTPKVKCYLPKEFLHMLESIEHSNIEHRTKIMLEILAANGSSINKLMDQIKKIRSQYRKDGQLHDCSISTGYVINGTGITYMIAKDRRELDYKLHNYCLYKFDTLKAEIWVGIGDLNPVREDYNIKCGFIAKRCSL